MIFLRTAKMFVKQQGKQTEKKSKAIIRDISKDGLVRKRNGESSTWGFGEGEMGQC